MSHSYLLAYGVYTKFALQLCCNAYFSYSFAWWLLDQAFFHLNPSHFSLIFDRIPIVLALSMLVGVGLQHKKSHTISWGLSLLSVTSIFIFGIFIQTFDIIFI